MARGTIVRRKKKSGGTTFDIKYRTGDGTQVKKAVGPSRKEAERALTEALAAVDRGQRRTTSRETFAEAAEAWLAAKRPRIEPATHRDYGFHIQKRLIPAFGHLKLREVTRSRIEKYVADLAAEERLSAKTINDSLIPLRQILDRAVRAGAISANPAAAMRDSPLELPYEPPTMLFLSREDALLYLSACPPWYRPLAEVLLGAGLRIGEAVALEWRDVDWDASALSVSRSAKDKGDNGTPKGDRSRSVAVAPYLIDLLREHRRRQSEDGQLGKLIFMSPKGEQLDRHNVRRRGHDRAVRDAGLAPGLRLHDLRHTAATLWLAAGESIFFVQQQLGHRDIGTTVGTYGHADQAAHRQAAVRAAAWWREGVSG